MQAALIRQSYCFRDKEKWPIEWGSLRYVYNSKLVTCPLVTKIVRIGHCASGTYESQYGRYLTTKSPTGEWFWGAFLKLQKATICFVFVMSVRPNGTARLPLDGFSWNFVFQDFSKIRRENLSSIKISQG
jgi:hypothetical protein